MILIFYCLNDVKLFENYSTIGDERKLNDKRILVINIL